MSDKVNVICPSCGASYNRELTECPYCGSAGFYGQEKRYMTGLAGIRQRMSELADIRAGLVIKEAVKVLAIVLITAALIVSAVALIKAYDHHNDVVHFNQIREELIDENR